MEIGLRKAIGKRSQFDSLEQEVFLNLVRTADQLSRMFEATFKQHGLSSTQYNVLRILRGEQASGLPCGQIAQRMITQDPDMTRLLDRLEKRGLISRCRETNDRRVVRARIGEAGVALLAQLDEPIRVLHREQLAHVEKKKLQELLRLLEDIRSAAPAQLETTTA